MKKNFLYITLFFLSCSLFGQKEANHWIVGSDGSEIDFNSSPPTASNLASVFPNIFRSYRGSSAISDKNGNLLMYTNGARIWNKNDGIMPNGTLPNSGGSYNYAQGSIIVPLPGSDSLFYVFYFSWGSYTTIELLYSVVDMTQDAGLGDVLPGQKDIFCNNNTIYPMLTAVRHSNGQDLWIIVHDRTTNNFSSYLLTSSGWTSSTIPTPVVSSVGLIPTFTLEGSCLNPSNDGSKIAAAFTMNGKWELYDFDKSTGFLSNPLTLSAPPGFLPMDIEFSPNDQVLYGSAQNMGIRQWDLSSGNPDTIQVKFNDLPMSAFHQLQLAPNCKIYARHTNVASVRNLDVINDPNKYGMDPVTGLPLCDYVLGALPLSSVTNINQFMGLPNIPLNIFDKVAEFNSSTVCYGDSTEFSIVSCFKITTDTYNWNFDDVASGSNNISTKQDTKHLYSKAGTFNVRLIITHNTGTKDTIINSVVVNPVPDVDFGNDTSICQGDHVTLNATIPNAASYLWQDLLAGGAPTYLATVAPYTYWVTATDNNGCFDKDTIFIDTYDAPVLSNDTAICPGETIVLSASSNPNAPVLWNNSTTPSPTFLVTGPGTYWASICNINDTIIVTAKDIKDCEDTTITPPPTLPTVVSIPNTFTPNNDGQNDVFIAVTATGITTMQTTIFNRWGKEEFTSDNLKIEWNGKSKNGNDASDGTYFYVVNYTGTDGKTVVVKGTIQLIR